MKVERKTVLVSGMPAEVKRAAIERADTSMNDEMVGVLARRLSVPFTPVGRRGPRPEVEDNGKIMLRMPAALKKRIVQEAVRGGSNQSAVIVSHLAAEYGIAHEARPSRTVPIGGGRRAEAAA